MSLPTPHTLWFPKSVFVEIEKLETQNTEITTEDLRLGILYGKFSQFCMQFFCLVPLYKLCETFPPRVRWTRNFISVQTLFTFSKF